MTDHKRHCCDEERGCYALDCDSEEAECTCGCLRCDNAPESNSTEGVK